MALGVAYKRESKSEKNVVGIEDVLEILNSEVSWQEKMKVRGRELLENTPLEGPCILICEIGDLAVTAASMASGIASPLISNSLGFLGGIALGGSYARWHVKKNAERNNRKPSKIEILKATAMAEGGCILGATLTTSILGYLTSVNYDNFSQEGLAIRAASLIPAFIVGDIAMSYLSLKKKEEVARFAAKSKQTGDLNQFLYENLKGIGFGEKIGRKAYVDRSSSGDEVALHSGNYKIAIAEKKLPEVYHDRFNPDENSLYVVRSGIVKYLPNVINPLTSFAGDSFKSIGYNAVKVEDPFSHSHSNDNRSRKHKAA